ncbi:MULTISPECIES: response regulator [unclassified Pedobacter]|uniref:response regulator n=1 Tax=Pedobacter TaxID=84567 RepID=UPI000B4B308D|nr:MULTISPECIES: response regulator [unclassified Pedobacter]MCX2430768.1 response regulator [Pedobacter sp. GR22-10]OWK69632.1 hypothetical protein CBW18_15935 [Pedobacter sp. AJM]
MEGSKILIILKDSETRSKISDILRISKYVVESTDNGKTAIEIVRGHPPDLIICGIDLYGVDGYGVLRMVNKFIDTANIPIVMLLKKGDHNGVRRTMEIGAEGYLMGDFDDAELLNQVEVRLRKKRLQVEFFLKQHFQQKIPSHSGELFWLDVHRAKLTARFFKKNQVVYYKGESRGGLYYVLSGKVKSFISNTSGHELITDLYTAGDYFGIQDFALGTAAFNTVKAIDDSEIIAIPLNEVNKIVVEHPETLGFFVKKLADTANKKDIKALELAYSTVKQRVSKTIIRLAGEGKSPAEKKRVNLTRNDLAGLIGIAAETLSRILGDFAKEDLIEKDGNAIVLKKLEHTKTVTSET